MLVVSEAALKRYNLKPRARIAHMSVRGDDPVIMLTAPISATRHALKKSGMKLDDIDLVEINEAFASVAMAWLKDLDYPHAKTNVNGGAIALGHPIGATGTKLMTTLLHELERTGWPLRPANHVRRRWPGQRHHHRAAVSQPPCKAMLGKRFQKLCQKPGQKPGRRLGSP